MLFSIFINSLGKELNSTSHGLPLSNLCISALFFADDLVLIGKNKEALQKLMLITRRFFKQHKLEISDEKSKVMTHNAETGETRFEEDHFIPSISLENVIEFKYLGIKVSTSPYGFFRAYNENVKKVANKYMGSVLSLVKSGPDRAELAYTLWVNCAIPAILYGCEAIPLHKGTIDAIEKCQTRVGRFILQIPTSSSKAAVYVDAG